MENWAISILQSVLGGWVGKALEALIASGIAARLGWKKKDWPWPKSVAVAIALWASLIVIGSQVGGYIRAVIPVHLQIREWLDDTGFSTHLDPENSKEVFHLIANNGKDYEVVIFQNKGEEHLFLRTKVVLSKDGLKAFLKLSEVKRRELLANIRIMILEQGIEAGLLATDKDVQVVLLERLQLSGPLTKDAFFSREFRLKIVRDLIDAHFEKYFLSYDATNS